MRYPLVQRGLIALVLVLAMTVWFSASAVVPALAGQWRLSAGATAWMTAPVQAGFVLGAVGSAALGLADRIGPHLLVAGCAPGAAACTLVMALFADGPLAAVPLRFATGVFLAGVYPVCMKLMASWSAPADRALAMGMLIGCLAMFADRGPRLVSLAYFGHMWELYALWSWLPTFLAVSRTTTAGLPAPGASGIDAFLAIGVAGLAGCLLGGWAADRVGRAATAAAALAVSGTCCLLSPMFFTAGRPWLLAFAAVWGAAVIADSGVFSTLLSELADRRYLGTALTTQTAIGFGLTIVTIQAIPLTAAVTGWRYAFLALAAGPMTALPALAALSRQIRPNDLPST